MYVAICTYKVSGISASDKLNFFGNDSDVVLFLITTKKKTAVVFHCSFPRSKLAFLRLSGMCYSIR